MPNRKSAESPEMPVEETIAAIATPVGQGGIGIVRISGKNAAAIARKLFRPHHRTQKATQVDFLPHHLHYGHIIEPANGRVVDEVLIAYMPGPHSYTREDVVEVQSHAGAAVLGRIFTLILESGARCAEPGEFTRRAFLNGRIDLSQAEAVADLICADSERAAQLATEQLVGGIRSRIDRLLSEIDDLCAEIEAYIEFPEDVEGLAEYKALQARLSENIMRPVQKLIESYAEGRFVRDGIRIAIAGRPNVGKSSLLNRLIENDKAIVTAIPGTTRDPVEAGLLFKGISMRFIDTAGIHGSKDPVEAIGIQKSKEAIADADLVLLVVDAEESSHAGSLEVFAGCKNKETLLVVNKIDLVNNDASIQLPEEFQQLPVIFISALTGSGLGYLKDRILKSCVKELPTQKEYGMVSNIRHKHCLEDALKELGTGFDGFANGLPLDLISIDLTRAGEELRKITGVGVERDLLDLVFSRFCIGK